MHRIATIFLLLLFAASQVAAQNTVGLLSYEATKAYEGYNLFFPHNQSSVYLLDNCGEIAHQWTDAANFRPGNIAYLLEDGRLVKGKRDANISDDAIWAGGGGETVEIRSWDNEQEWSFTINDSLRRLHHDIEPMPNGNILMIVWEYKSEAEAIAAGRDTALLSQGALWPDYIIEVDPTTDEIVWEWHAWDHLIQDFDSTKANYGVVADHPEKINLNWDTNNGKADWMHTNAIDFNAELNQIIISVPTFHEFWVIDHSTTTEQAAGSTGGLGNRGGDLLYRWGNPATYDRGDASDQQLFYPHDVHWVDEHVDASFPFYNRIALFNNRVGSDFSTANILAPAWDMYDWQYTLEADNTFGPADFDETYTHPTPTQMHSTGLSSIQMLPNGNTLLCSGRYGYTFEMTPDSEIVWEYVTPIKMGAAATQGDTLAINNNLTFRMKRYPADYAAFTGRDLSPKGWIEQEPDSTYCDQLVADFEPINERAFKVYPNPADQQLVVEWNGMMHADIEVFNALGHRVAAFPRCSGGRKYLETSQWPNGMYILTIDRKYSRKIVINR